MKLATRGLSVLAAVAALAIGGATAPSSAAPAVHSKATVARSTVTPSTVKTSSPAKITTKRSCGAAKAGHMTCFSIRRTDVKEPGAFKLDAVVPNATPSGITPANLDSAYKLSTSAGSGQTVAIVDAYNDTTAASDLTTYRSQFGLPACTTASGCLKIVNQSGGTTLPASDTGWAGEESLDLDMVSAICPLCHIILVEASSATDANLYAAEDEAVALGAKFVSNSWGGDESSTQTSDDSHFNHPGVAITVSSGDDATGAEYPATSRYVTAVGGTHLVAASNTRGWTETAWSDAGSGCSAYDAKPPWQTVTTNCTRRAEADVSAVADPATGVAVYQTYGGSGWTVYGGTSVAAPVIAGVYALAGAPGASDYAASYPYAHQSSLFDVTSGSNGSCGAPICTAGVGWDGPTGLGTPNGTAAFTAGSGTATLTANNPGNQTASVGTAFNLALSASGGTTPYTWSATGLPAGLTISTSTGVDLGNTEHRRCLQRGRDRARCGVAHGDRVVHDHRVAASTCPPAQKLLNPGFESGRRRSWTATAGVIGQNGPAETGALAARGTPGSTGTGRPTPTR